MPQAAGENGPPQGKIRVLVVDDSAFMRMTLSRYLNEMPDMTVVASARDGREALELIDQFEPDVVTLDVEMPQMDGLTTLRKIMASRPTPVIMLSSLTMEGARETILALTWGAVDFVTKPQTRANISAILQQLIDKIRQAARAKPARVHQPVGNPIESAPAKPPPRPMAASDQVVVIGASTGGPRALNALLPELQVDLPAAYLVVQHMPVGFTRSLAERLDALCQVRVKEAAPGDRLASGTALVAPGGFHMLLDQHGAVSLNQNPTVHGVRPAVDVTLASVAQHFGKAAMAVILTGMGKDGTNGCLLVRSEGGYVIAEDESSCVVYGMPRSVYEAGAADEVAPLPEISFAIRRALSRRVKFTARG